MVPVLKLTRFGATFLGQRQRINRFDLQGSRGKSQGLLWQLQAGVRSWDSWVGEGLTLQSPFRTWTPTPCLPLRLAQASPRGRVHTFPRPPLRFTVRKFSFTLLNCHSLSAPYTAVCTQIRASGVEMLGCSAPGAAFTISPPSQAGAEPLGSFNLLRKGALLPCLSNEETEA